MNYVQLVEACENALGWVPRDQHFKTKTNEASILKRQAEKEGLTAADLTYIIGWARDRKVEVKRPSALVYMAKRAFADKVEADKSPSPLMDDLYEAIAMEDQNGDPDGWGDRLHRVMGLPEDVVRDVLVEWRGSVSKRGREEAAR